MPLHSQESLSQDLYHCNNLYIHLLACVAIGTNNTPGCLNVVAFSDATSG